jgi:hypothetical protein
MFCVTRFCFLPYAQSPPAFEDNDHTHIAKLRQALPSLIGNLSLRIVLHFAALSGIRPQLTPIGTGNVAGITAY